MCAFVHEKERKKNLNKVTFSYSLSQNVEEIRFDLLKKKSEKPTHTYFGKYNLNRL